MALSSKITAILTDWVNSQSLTNPVICLGDGHDGVWNLFKEIATTSQRQEILDWYHLKENLYKVGGAGKRLKQAEALLWRGRVEDAIAIFDSCHSRQVINFRAYLKKHRLRLVDYDWGGDRERYEIDQIRVPARTPC